MDLIGPVLAIAHFDHLYAPGTTEFLTEKRDADGIS